MVVTLSRISVKVLLTSHCMGMGNQCFRQSDNMMLSAQEGGGFDTAIKRRKAI